MNPCSGASTDNVINVPLIVFSPVGRRHVEHKKMFLRAPDLEGTM